MRPLRLRREQTCQGPLVLIDRAHPLQEGAPPELVPVDRLHPQVLLERRAAGLLAACIRSVGGGRTIVPVSGWRSRAEQQAIWDDTRARGGGCLYPAVRGPSGVQRAPDRPGHRPGGGRPGCGLYPPQLPRLRRLRRFPTGSGPVRLPPALPPGEGGPHWHRRMSRGTSAMWARPTPS